MSNPSANPSPSFDASLSSRGVGIETLERIRNLLSVAWVGVYRLDRSDFDLLASAGSHPAPPPLHQFNLRASQQTLPLVLGQAGDGTIKFYAGITFVGGDGGSRYLLALADNRTRSPEAADRLARLASDVFIHSTLASRGAASTRHALDEKRQAELFDIASATAKIGIWQCDLLNDNALTWTDGVYDLFELPRNTPITRETTLKLYSDASRLVMEKARALAIAEGVDMNLEAEIITAKGNRRWMRLTGTVERLNGKSIRILGTKQNITEQKLLADRTRYLAECDVMTGLANRGQFQSYLDDMDGRRIGALLLVDLDGFKQINDTYGHAIGDACIKQAAIRLTQCCSGASLVARVGGDEFGVLIDTSVDAAAVEAMASRIVTTMAQPVVTQGHSLPFGASVGVAHRHLQTAEDLFRHADYALYAAKAAGRNTSRTFELAA